MGAPPITGFGHIDLTVTDGARAARWWEEVLGFRPALQQERDGRRSWAMFHPCFLSVIMIEHSDLTSDRFDERAVGLDHFAMTVPDRDALAAWAAHLDACGVAHSGIQEEIGGPLIVFRDPDNIQLELWAFDIDQVPHEARARSS